MLKNNQSKNFKILRQQAEKLSFSTASKNKDFSNIDIEGLIHELDVHKIELEMQNDELQHTISQLGASQRRYFELYEFAPVGYLSLDENNRIVEANRTAVDLLGIAKTKLINKRFTDFINESYQDVFFLLFRRSLLTKNKQSCELKLIRKGERLYAHIESLVKENTSINSHYLYLSMTDITNKKLAEEQFRRHQFELNQIAQLNAMGTLASALAHELTQPIGATNAFINGCIRRLEGKTYQKTHVIAAMKQAAQQAERAGNIIHHMKDFVRKGRLHHETIDINKIIQEAIYLIEQEPWQVEVEISLTLPDSPILVLADKLQIELVILNLIHNGIEAMVEANITKPKIMIEAIKINTDFIKISVSDIGPGIATKNTEKLFDPFFTTKPNGLGVGLAMCQNIISTYGGEICAKNGNRGACFEFTFPIVEPALSA